MWIIISLALIGVVSAFFFKRFGQDPAYHHFADTRNIFSIPNFWNVISNLPFFIIGGTGMIYIIKKKPAGMLQELTIHYFFLWGYFSPVSDQPGITLIPVIKL